MVAHDYSAVIARPSLLRNFVCVFQDYRITLKDSEVAGNEPGIRTSLNGCPLLFYLPRIPQIVGI